MFYLPVTEESEHKHLTSHKEICYIFFMLISRVFIQFVLQQFCCVCEEDRCKISNPGKQRTEISHVNNPFTVIQSQKSLLVGCPQANSFWKVKPPPILWEWGDEPCAGGPGWAAGAVRPCVPADLSSAPSGDCRRFVVTTNISFEGFCFKISCMRSAHHRAHGVLFVRHAQHTNKGRGSTLIRGSAGR